MTAPRASPLVIQLWGGGVGPNFDVEIKIAPAGIPRHNSTVGVKKSHASSVCFLAYSTDEEPALKWDGFTELDAGFKFHAYHRDG